MLCDYYVIILCRIVKSLFYCVRYEYYLLNNVLNSYFRLSVLNIFELKNKKYYVENQINIVKFD